MDRSTRNLSLITLIVIIVFLALNYVAKSSPIGDWWPSLVLALVALAIWGYDRLSRRGVDDSQAADTEIEPITYERPMLAAAAPGAMYQQAEAHPVAHAADVLIPAPAGTTTAVPRSEPLVAPPPAAPAAPVADNPPAPEASATPDEKPAPSPPEPEQHPPAAAPETTTIEEKSAPPPSAPAPETDPEQAAHAPDGVSLPAVPVEDASGRPDTLSKPTEGTAPEPQATKKGKTVGELDVSATPLANAAPASTLPINADPAKPDDLKVIEGIGPKMEKALHAAGITTFAQLSGASEAEINAAILAAGMRFAPTVPTWAEQASYAANGDFVGLETYQKTLIGGRKAK